MAAKSYDLDDEIINVYLRNQVATITPAATVYVALYTVAPTAAGGGTEVANSFDYARTAVTMGAPVNGVSSNTAPVTFPPANGGAWGLVAAMAIFDSGTYGAGNMLYFGALGTSKQVNDGDQVNFAVSALQVTES